MIPFVDNLMPFRYQHLEYTLKGLDSTGVALVEHNGVSFMPAGVSDDTGIYFFIPQIAKFFNLGLDLSISLFFSFLLIVSLAAAVLSVFGLIKKRSHRLFSLAFLGVLSIYLILRGDIYTLSALSALVVIPLTYYLRTKNLKIRYLILQYFLFGLLIALSNFVRSNSGTAVMIFLISFLVIEYFYSKKKFLLFFCILCIGFLSGNAGISSIKHSRDTFLLKQGISSKEMVEGHVFWHSVYIGFGYLNNNYGIKYDDDFAYARARMLNPSILIHSNEYEELMRDEVFKLIKNDPWFVVKTITSKMGLVLFYLILFSNIGLYYIIKSIKNSRISVPLLLALFFNMSFPLVVMPFPGYMIGVVGIIILFSILSLETNSNPEIEQNNFRYFFRKTYKGEN